MNAVTHIRRISGSPREPLDLHLFDGFWVAVEVSSFGERFILASRNMAALQDEVLSTHRFYIEQKHQNCTVSIVAAMLDEHQFQRTYRDACYY